MWCPKPVVPPVNKTNDLDVGSPGSVNTNMFHGVVFVYLLVQYYTHMNGLVVRKIIGYIFYIIYGT
jgi:hypothetical protein